MSSLLKISDLVTLPSHIGLPIARYGKRRTTSATGPRGSLPYTGIVLHDPAIGPNNTPVSVYNYINRDKSKGWYHVCVGNDSAVSQKTVLYLDPSTHTSAHSGSPYNSHTIGICVAQQNVHLKKVSGTFTDVMYKAAIERDLRTLIGKGIATSIVKRSSRWYPWELTLDAHTASTTASLVACWCHTYDIPRVVYVGTRSSSIHSVLEPYTTSTGSMIERRVLKTVKDGAPIGVCCHRHLVGASRMDISGNWLSDICDILVKQYGFTLHND
jgi:hypothetical protein